MNKKNIVKVMAIMCGSIALLSACNEGDKGHPESKGFTTLEEAIALMDHNFSVDVSLTVSSASSNSYGYRFIDEDNILITSNDAYMAYHRDSNGVSIIQKDSDELSFSPYRLYSPNAELDIYSLLAPSYDALKILGADAWEEDDGTYSPKSEKNKEIALMACNIIETGLTIDNILQSSYALITIEDNVLTWEGVAAIKAELYGEIYTSAIAYNFIYSDFGGTYNEAYEAYLNNPSPLKAPTGYHEQIVEAFETIEVTLPWVEGFGVGMAEGYNSDYNMYTIDDCTGDIETVKNFVTAFNMAGWVYTPASDEEANSIAAEDVVTDSWYTFKLTTAKGVAYARASFVSVSHLDEEDQKIYPNGLFEMNLMAINGLSSD